MNAGFVGQYMFTDDRLVQRNRACSRGCHQRGDILEFRQHDAGVTPVELFERDRDFFQRRIAGPLAEPDDGHRGVARATLDGGERIGGRKPEIVMAVKFGLETGGRAQTSRQRIGGVRIEHTERIGNTKAPCAGGFCGGDQLDEKIDVSAGGVLAADGNLKPTLARITDHPPHLLQR